jgi:conjugative transfer region protein TrbK
MRIGGQTFLRVVAGAFAAAAIVMAAIQATRGPDEAEQSVRSATLPSADPLTAEVARCAAMGEAALGRDHPSVAEALLYASKVSVRKGNADEAKASQASGKAYTVPKKLFVRYGSQASGAAPLDEGLQQHFVRL